MTRAITIALVAMSTILVACNTGRPSSSDESDRSSISQEPASSSTSSGPESSKVPNESTSSDEEPDEIAADDSGDSDDSEADENDNGDEDVVDDDDPASPSSSTVTSLQKPAQRVTVEDQDPIRFTGVSVKAYYPHPRDGEDRLVLTMTTDRCVFAKVTGATTLARPDFYAERCLSFFEADLVLLGAGTHTVNVTATDRDGTSASESVTFNVADVSEDPCRQSVPDPDPSPLYVVVNEESAREFQPIGNCGDLKLRILQPVDGFWVDGLTLRWNVGGPARSERVSVALVPTVGEEIRIDFDVEIFNEQQPEAHVAEPCTLNSAGGLTRDGVLVVDVVIGGPPQVIDWFTFGPCGRYQLNMPSTPVPGVVFEDYSFTASAAEGPARSVEFDIVLITEQGEPVNRAVKVNFVEP